MLSDWWKNALLLAGSLLVCGLIGEVAVRLLLPARFDRSPSFPTAHHLHRSDPLIGWVLSPDPVEFHHRLDDRYGAVQYDVRYHVDRGQRRTSAEPHAGQGIVATGCSFTFGHGLDDQDTWPWLLQERLPNDHLENVGCMGYGTDQALLAAERQLQRSPGRITAVVLGFGDFQIERTRATQGWISHVYPFSKPLFARSLDGVEYQRQVRFWSAGSFLEHSALFMEIVTTFANRLYRIPSHAEARSLTVALIASFAKRFQALGSRLAVVVLPYIGDSLPESRADTAFVIEGSRAAGVPVLAPDFPRLADGRIDVKKYMVSRIDRHPNRQYNLILAEQLDRFLKANGFLGDAATMAAARPMDTRMLAK